MKDTPLSNCERDFLLRAISEKKVGFSQNIYKIARFTKLKLWLSELWTTYHVTYNILFWSVADR